MHNGVKNNTVWYVCDTETGAVLLPGHALPFVLAGAAFTGATRPLVGCSKAGTAADTDRCEMKPQEDWMLHVTAKRKDVPFFATVFASCTFRGFTSVAFCTCCCFIERVTLVVWDGAAVTLVYKTCCSSAREISRLSESRILN